MPAATLETSPRRSPDACSALGGCGRVEHPIDVARRYAAALDVSDARVPVATRRYRRIGASATHEAWAISWPTGGAVDLHDHGGASGAFVVVAGRLRERFVGPAAVAEERTLIAGRGVEFPDHHVHGLVNPGTEPAFSVHVYRPRLEAMTFYRVSGSALVAERSTSQEDPTWWQPSM